MKIEILDLSQDRKISLEEMNKVMGGSFLSEPIQFDPLEMRSLTDMQSMQLQIAMDRRSKQITMLSQMMKKIGTTQETLVQNIK